MKDSIADKLRACRPALTLDRCSELLLAAHDRVQGGEPDRAVEIWKSLIAGGGEDADRARLDFAEYLFDEHEDGAAFAELDAVLAPGRIFSKPWLRAVEMVEEHEPETALFLYLLAIESITTEHLRSPVRTSRYLHLLATRRRLRWELGVRLTDADLLIEIGWYENRIKCLSLLRLVAETQIVEEQPRFWDRGTLDALTKIWGPGTFPTSPTAYYLEIEAVLQPQGGRRKAANRMGMTDWARLKASATNARHLDDLEAIVRQYDGGTVVEWPPGRNQVCWCGSGTKYKKCCGGLPATSRR